MVVLWKLHKHDTRTARVTFYSDACQLDIRPVSFKYIKVSYLRVMSPFSCRIFERLRERSGSCSEFSVRSIDVDCTVWIRIRQGRFRKQAVNERYRHPQIDKLCQGSVATSKQIRIRWSWKFPRVVWRSSARPLRTEPGDASEFSPQIAVRSPCEKCEKHVHVLRVPKLSIIRFIWVRGRLPTRFVFGLIMKKSIGPRKLSRAWQVNQVLIGTCVMAANLVANARDRSIAASSAAASATISSRGPIPWIPSHPGIAILNFCTRNPWNARFPALFPAWAESRRCCRLRMRASSKLVKKYETEGNSVSAAAIDASVSGTD